MLAYWLLAQLNLDSLGSYATDAVQLGVLGTGMLAAYRVATKASADAIAVYRSAAADSTSRLEAERHNWQEERRALLDENARLLLELHKLGGHHSPSKRADDSATPPAGGGGDA